MGRLAYRVRARGIYDAPVVTVTRDDAGNHAVGLQFPLGSGQIALPANKHTAAEVFDKAHTYAIRQVERKVIGTL